MKSGMDYKRTSVDWANFVRDMCKKYVHDYINSGEKLAGNIELDESVFGRKVKYNRGNPRGQKIWIFGMIDRVANNLILYPVDKRDANTLIPLIERHVERGSTIYSDGWAAYNSLTARGYTHLTVNHTESFTAEYTNTVTGEVVKVNTNKIEGAWAHAKKHFRKINGTSVSNFEAHLCEIMWRSHGRGDNIYRRLFDMILKYYPLHQPPVLDFPTPVFNTWDPHTREHHRNVGIHRDSSVEEDHDSIADETPPVSPPHVHVDENNSDSEEDWLQDAQPSAAVDVHVIDYRLPMAERVGRGTPCLL